MAAIGLSLLGFDGIPASAAAAGACVNAPATALPSSRYSIPLHSLFTPKAKTMGLYLKARIDGGPVLRLLLDSGARHLVLDKHAAAALGREPVSTLELVGVGTAAKTARRVSPGTLEIADLVLPHCDILTVDIQLLEGIDGVIPMSLFSGFLVRLDMPGKTLHLESYPDAPVDDAGYSPARTDNCLLFVPAVLNEHQAGYVLLDTGATYNAVAPASTRAWKSYRLSSPNIDLRGGAGLMAGFLLPAGVSFRLGSRVLPADPAVVVDLSAFSSPLPFKLAGILGYPALRRSVLTVNYRDGLVRMDPR